jgi:hypothetical protein
MLGSSKLPNMSQNSNSKTNLQMQSINNPELEADEILKYIKDAYQIPKLISATDLLSEEEKLKLINSSAKKVPSLQLNTETLSRGESKFTTQVSNTEIAYKRKQDRRDSNMKCGFFSRQGQPYASVGQVYTSNAALLQSTLMTDVVHKLKYRAAEKNHKSNTLEAILQQNIEVKEGNISGQNNNSNNSNSNRRGNSRGQSRGSSRGRRNRKKLDEILNTEKTTNQNQQDPVGVISLIKNNENKDLPNDPITKSSTGNRRMDSGIKQIRQKLSYTNKMRTDVNGGIDLLSSLDELQYKEKFNNYANSPENLENDEEGELNVDSSAGLLDPNNNSSNNKNSNCKNKKFSKKSQHSNEPWKNIKTRKQMIKDIAKNQMNQVAHEQACVLEAQNLNRKFSYTTNSANNKYNKNKVKSPWTKVKVIGKIAHATKTVITDNNQKNGGFEADELEDKEIQAKRRFLGLISQLLSALYNMKKNSVKSAEPLSELEVKELLNSEIEIDEEGKPKPKVIRQQLYTKFDNSKRISVCQLINSNAFTGALNASNGGANDTRKSRALGAIGGMRINKKFKDLIKTSKIMKDQKVATWEDLLAVDVATGQINPPSSPQKAVRGLINNQIKDDLAPSSQAAAGNFIPSEIIYDNVINNQNIKTSKPIWLRNDRHGFDMDKQYLLNQGSNASGEPIVATSNKFINNCNSGSSSNSDLKNKHEKTQKMKIEFDNTKAALSKDLHLELEYRRQQQALLIRNKLLSLKLGPISSVSLEKMRRDAHKMVKDQQLLTPLKTPAWFSKLERLYGKRNYEILQPHLHGISRFQRYPVSGVCDTSKLTSGHDIQHNKLCYLKALDKLCLIMASLPAYEVLEENCNKAFEFIIKEILGFPEDTYGHWIKLRQLRTGEIFE